MMRVYSLIKDFWLLWEGLGEFVGTAIDGSRLGFDLSLTSWTGGLDGRSDVQKRRPR